MAMAAGLMAASVAIGFVLLRRHAAGRTLEGGD
jgi:hypothetical protein